MMKRGAYAFHKCPGTPPSDPKWARLPSQKAKLIAKKTSSLSWRLTPSVITGFRVVAVVASLVGFASLAMHQYGVARIAGPVVLLSLVVCLVELRRGSRP
jgi:uncharacterized membrane protein YtjA (UPF0391 family)